MVTKNKQANKQPVELRARLLLTTEKAVFCNIYQAHTMWVSKLNFQAENTENLFYSLGSQRWGSSQPSAKEWRAGPSSQVEIL